MEPLFESTKSSLQRYAATGPSMEPFIFNGDELLVSSIANKPLDPGDILLYQSSRHQKPIAHRLIQIENEGNLLTLRSDFAPDVVEKILKDAVYGRVVGVIRQGRLIDLSHKGLWKQAINRVRIHFYPGVITINHYLARGLFPILSFIQSLSLYRKIAARQFGCKAQFDFNQLDEHLQLRVWIKNRFAGSLDLHEESDSPKRLYVSSLFVRLRYRGAGIGAQLIQKAEEYAREKGYSGLILLRENHDTVTEKFYGKLGFQDCGDSKGKRLMKKELSFF